MSEDEWMDRDWPTSMLKLVDSLAEQPRPRWNAKVVRRQLRLAACAACRRIERLLDPPRRDLVEVAERYALGQASWREFRKAASAIGGTPELRVARDDGLYYAAKAVGALPDDAAAVIGFVLSASLRDPDQPEALTGYCAGLLRCLFGNPYQPLIAAIPHEWRTDTVLTLARQMYDSRDFGAMPILADALQDAGCDSDDILSHCRDLKQMHVRGCWVVDLVLGKA